MVLEVTYSYADSRGWGDLLTNFDGRNFQYDEIGNLLSDGEWTYTWSKGRQLASMSKPGSTLTFTYDADGNRITKTVNGTTTTYTYADGRVTHETNGTDTIHYRYDTNGTLLSIHQHELIPHVRGLLHPRADGVRGGVVRLLLAEPAAAVRVAVIHDGLYARDGILPPQRRCVKIRVLGGRRRRVLPVLQTVGDVARDLVVVIRRLERVVIAARAQRLEVFRPRHIRADGGRARQRAHRHGQQQRNRQHQTQQRPACSVFHTHSSVLSPCFL